MPGPLSPSQSSILENNQCPAINHSAEEKSSQESTKHKQFTTKPQQKLRAAPFPTVASTRLTSRRYPTRPLVFNSLQYSHPSNVAIRHPIISISFPSSLISSSNNYKNHPRNKKQNTSIAGAEGLQLEDQMSTRFRQPRFLWQTHVFQSSSSSKKKNIRITGEWTTMNIFGVNQVGEK